MQMQPEDYGLAGWAAMRHLAEMAERKYGRPQPPQDREPALQRELDLGFEQLDEYLGKHAEFQNYVERNSR